MPHRPRSHQVSDESRRAFERALPSHWVFRPEQPDYGIDGEVEVFDETGASTGLRFYVQLKATDGTDAQARSVRITREVGRYFHALDLPVLIVSYHAPSGALYARWFQEINPPDDEEDGTVAVTFEDANRWTRQTPGLLVRDVVLRRTLRGGAVAVPVLVALDREPPDAQATLVGELTSAAVRLRGIIELTDDVNRALATIVLRPGKVAVLLGKEAGRSMAVAADVTNHRALAADTLLLLALALGHTRQYSIAGKIALAVVDSSIMIERPSVFGPLVRYLAAGHRLTDALELSDRLATKYGSTWAAEAFRSLALTSRGMSAAERMVYEKYLDRRIELAKASGDKKQMAMAYYNRGNSRRGHRREAVRDYVTAARTDPDYWNRDYFCSELGGLFFVLHRFRCALTCYERSMARGAGIETQPLLADALMFAGQYERAKAEFESYLSTRTKELSPQWRLKDWALTQILKLGILIQNRQTRAALAMADNPAALDDALQLDALCGLAWFNKGAGQLEANERRTAFVYYLMAAVSQDWDIVAWRNAFALSMEHKEDQVAGPYILLAAYELHGERLLEELFTATKGASDKRNEFIRDVQSRLEEWLPRKNKGPEMRMLGPNSEYISFDLGSGTVTHKKPPDRKDDH